MTLPHQYTDKLLLWAYALDGKQHAMFWLSPANEETDPFSPVLRHWQSAAPIRADILPGMHFFDAWRIVPTMQIEPDNHEDLDSFEEVLPSREKWEFRAQTDARTNAQLAQEQTLQARAQNKTSAQMASEIAQVHKLTTLLAERVDFLADSRERLRRVPFKKSPVIFVCQSSSSHHHHLIIMIISSSSHHHHLLIIISPSSSSFPSLSLAFLFFSNLAQPSSHEKRARRNPSQGKCVSSVKN